MPHTSVLGFRKRGKTEICRPGPGITLSRSAVLLPRIELRSGVVDFSRTSGFRVFKEGAAIQLLTRLNKNDINLHAL